MAGITLAQAEAKLQLWLNAEEAVASGQSYSIGSRSLTRANLTEISERINYWNGQVKTLSASAAGRRRVRNVVFE